MSREVVAAALEDWRTAPVDERLRAALGYLETVTLRPEALTPADARRAIDAGVSAEALREAVYVAFLFNVLDRIAGALDFAEPGPRDAARIAWAIRTFGYRGRLPG